MPGEFKFLMSGNKAFLENSNSSCLGIRHLHMGFQRCCVVLLSFTFFILICCLYMFLHLECDGDISFDSKFLCDSLLYVSVFH